jgi:hypothetical protein
METIKMSKPFNENSVKVSTHFLQNNIKKMQQIYWHPITRHKDTNGNFFYRYSVFMVLDDKLYNITRNIAQSLDVDFKETYNGIYIESDCPSEITGYLSRLVFGKENGQWLDCQEI